MALESENRIRVFPPFHDAALTFARLYGFDGLRKHVFAQRHDLGLPEAYMAGFARIRTGHPIANGYVRLANARRDEALPVT